MKKIILLLSVVLIASCSSADCGSQLSDLEKQYQKTWINCGNSYPCIQNATNQYNSKKQNILNNCE